MNKNWLKQVIYGLELRGIAIISNGLVHRTPKRTVLSLIRKEIKRFRAIRYMNDAEINGIYAEFYSLYLRISKRTFSKLRKIDEKYDEYLRIRRDIVYETVRNEAIYNDRLEKNKNYLADSIERRVKREEIFGYKGLLSDHSSPFVICSVRSDSAGDHADWQGKIYYDEDWESYISDNDRADRARIAEFIQENDLKSVQWVTGKPVWLVTRPNCRHFFRKVSIDEALEEDVKTLILRNEMISDREIPMSREKIAYKGYYERLKALQYLKKLCPSDKLDQDIKKTSKLVRDWAYRAKQRG